MLKAIKKKKKNNHPAGSRMFWGGSLCVHTLAGAAVTAVTSSTVTISSLSAFCGSEANFSQMTWGGEGGWGCWGFRNPASGTWLATGYRWELGPGGHGILVEGICGTAHGDSLGWTCRRAQDAPSPSRSAALPPPLPTWWSDGWLSFHLSLTCGIRGKSLRDARNLVRQEACEGKTLRTWGRGTRLPHPPVTRLWTACLWTISRKTHSRTNQLWDE